LLGTLAMKSHPIISAPTVFLHAALALGLGCTGAPDAPDTGDGDPGDAPDDCGDVFEGEAECTGARDLVICDQGELVAYECPEGSLCEASSSTAEGVSCFCDGVADGICPDPACTNDVDCGEPECTGSDCEEAVDCLAEVTYAGDLFDREGGEKNVSRPDIRFMGFWGNLDLATHPDVLGVYQTYKNFDGTFGYATGTFTLPSAKVGVGICADRKDRFCQQHLTAVSGTVEITSINGTFAATATDLVFELDNKPDAGCESAIESLSFELPL
jgi:hypothetical protein